jgi:dihydroflavonol-4-reductase
MVLSNAIHHVAVTGVTGHLGSVLARRLLAAGFRVRAVVRHSERLNEVPWVQGDGLEVAEADMTDSAAMANALKGVEGVFHVAAVFDVTQMSAAELVRINVTGVENVLRAGKSCGAKRFVLTSSAAGVGTSATKGDVRDEETWNDGAREAYARSKVLSERRAWELAEELGLDLVAVLPGALLGPGFNRLTPTLEMVTGALDNAFPQLPPIDFAFTDVRDVAEAHLRLFKNGNLRGRYLAAGPTLTFRELVQKLHDHRPEVRVPKDMPQWLTRALPPFDALAHLATGAPRKLRSGFVKDYVGRTHALSTDKLNRAIGWRPRPIENTIVDTLSWLREKQNVSLLD